MMCQTWIRRSIGSYGYMILGLGRSSQVHWTVTPARCLLWTFPLMAAFWLAGHSIAQSFYGTPPPGRGKVTLSSVRNLSIASICVRFSPSSQLGVVTHTHVQIWDLNKSPRKRLAQFDGHIDFYISLNRSLAWTRDGGHLLSA